jgi:hypothetical protein
VSAIEKAFLMECFEATGTEVHDRFVIWVVCHFTKATGLRFRLETDIQKKKSRSTSRGNVSSCSLHRLRGVHTPNYIGKKIRRRQYPLDLDPFLGISSL